MTDESDARTALDDAFEAAQADPDKTGAFFDALFAATLYIPIFDDVEQSGEREPGERSEITPLVFVMDERETVAVFDTEERLARFLDEPMNYIGVPGAAVFEMFNGDFQVALNLGVAPSSVVIPSENVAWLHEQATQGPQEVDLGDESLVIARPTGVTQTALAAITSALAGFRAEIDEATLFRIEREDGTEGRIVLGLAPTEAGKQRAEMVAHEIARAARTLANGVDSIEIAMLDADSPMMLQAKKIGLPLPIMTLGPLN